MAAISLLALLSGAAAPVRGLWPSRFGLWPVRLAGGRDAAPVLSGPRVYLRWPRSEDHPAWARLRTESRAHLTPWEPTWPPDALTAGGFERRLRAHRRDVRDGAGYMFLVYRRDDEALLGGVSLSHVRRGAGASAEIGYWLGAPHGGQGYMSEAVQAVLGYAFDDLKLRRVEAACLPGNARSKALLARLGFQREGLARSYLCINGRWRDHELHALLADEWRQASPPSAPAATVAETGPGPTPAPGLAVLP